MAISVFPVPSAASGSNAFAADLTAKNTTYEQINNFDTGVYTVTCNPTSSNVTAVFANATSVISTVVTSSGTVGLSLATAATKVYLTLNNASTVPTIVTITKTASPLNPDDIGNGTLDTINATGTYNQTGLLSVLVIGGGDFGRMSGANGSGGTGPYVAGFGGRAGFINAGIVYTNTATTVTVGAKGTARTTPNGSDVTATASSFGNLITANVASNVWTNVNGGNGGGDSGAGGAGATTQTFASWNTNSTLGAGGGGNGLNLNPTGDRAVVRVGGGSGIGTGGSGGGSNDTSQSVNAGIANIAANAATGKGSGGGGGAGTGYGNPNAVGRFGKNGSDGVVYVLRGF